MVRGKLPVLALVVAIAASMLLFGFQSRAAQGAEDELPEMVVGDTYAFVGLEDGLVSGTLMSAGPHPWVEVKVDNVDANVYFINLEHVERFKHIVK